MKLNDFPADIQPHLLPSHAGRMVYRCLGCGGQFGIEQLLYVCPECRQVLLIEDLNGPRLKAYLPAACGGASSITARC